MKTERQKFVFQERSKFISWILKFPKVESVPTDYNPTKEMYIKLGRSHHGPVTLKQMIDNFPHFLDMNLNIKKTALELISETSLCRKRLEKYCIGDGIDVGYGGDPIVPSAITIDMQNPYYGPSWFGIPKPQNLKGDGKDLCWFRDCSLDYVYSSHLLEDFNPREMSQVLSEWLRVLKPGGYLILYLPDEQKYRAHCKKMDTAPNCNHKVDNFNLEFLKSLLGDLLYFIRIVHENPSCDNYSFEIVIRRGA